MSETPNQLPEAVENEEPNYLAIAEQVARLDPMTLDAFKEASPQGRFEVTRIQERHREIIRLLVLGWKNIEIAKHLGVTPVMVSYVRNSKLVQAKIAELHGVRDAQTLELKERIRQLGGVSIDVLEQALVDETTPLKERIQIAQDILDRAGQKPVARVVAEHNHTVISQSEMEEVHRRARSSGILVAEVVTVEAEQIVESAPVSAPVEEKNACG